MYLQVTFDSCVILKGYRSEYPKWVRDNDRQSIGDWRSKSSQFDFESIWHPLCGMHHGYSNIHSSSYMLPLQWIIGSSVCVLSVLLGTSAIQRSVSPNTHMICIPYSVFCLCHCDSMIRRADRLPHDVSNSRRCSLPWLCKQSLVVPYELNIPSIL